MEKVLTVGCVVLPWGVISWLAFWFLSKGTDWHPFLIAVIAIIIGTGAVVSFYYALSTPAHGYTEQDHKPN